MAEMPPKANAGEILLNPLANLDAPYGAAQAAILHDVAFEQANATISAWPGYALSLIHI